jgi:hypothetical protein
VKDAFTESLNVIKDLLNDGEVATVERKFQRVSLTGLRLLYTSPDDIRTIHNYLMLAPASTDDNKQTAAPMSSTALDTSGSQIFIDYHMVANTYELYCLRMLSNISQSTKRPSWIAANVKKNMFISLHTFIGVYV